MVMKGTNAERELCTELWNKGYATLRAPGSGSIDRPSPDVVALRNDIMHMQAYAIELKASQDGTARFREDEIIALIEWSERACAMPLVGVKPDLRSFESWLFRPVRELHETPTGYSLRKQDHKDCYGLEWFE